MQYDSGKVVRFKVILLGECGVGKTSIFQRFQAKNIPRSSKSCLSIDQYQYVREFPVGPNSRPAEVVLWDTANMERVHSLTENYFREATAALMVYDVADSVSLKRIPDWRLDVTKSSPMTQLFLIGNKIDLRASMFDSSHTTVEHAHQVMFSNMPDLVRLYDVSAKEDIGVEEMFHDIVQTLWESYIPYGTLSRSEGGELDDGTCLLPNGAIDVEMVKKKGKCCPRC